MKVGPLKFAPLEGRVLLANTHNIEAANTIVRVQGMSKTYGRVTALRDVHFSIRSGEFLGLIGPNGAGKTTLFECLACVQPADSGEFLPQHGSADAGQRSSILYYIPDGVAPWSNQSVSWVLQFTLGFFGGRRELYQEVVDDLSIAELHHVKIGALSKGQRKRVLLAMGVLMPQSLLLIDEPFEGLDLRQSREVSAVLRKQVSAGRTIFVSIHQISDAAKICDRLVLLSNGSVVAEGTPEDLTALAINRSRNSTPADFEEVFLALT
jgi:ABC-2 type transport system ATP-binding protein